jgi:hypothetical protein
MKSFNIRKEHETVEIELKELETVIDSGQEDELNYSNLLHVFKKLQDFWNSHETREEQFFSNLAKDKNFSFEKMTTAHRLLRGHFKVLNDAIKSNNETEIIASLDTDGRMLISKIREHMREEEELMNNLISNKSKVD